MKSLTVFKFKLWEEDSTFVAGHRSNLAADVGIRGTFTFMQASSLIFFIFYFTCNYTHTTLS